MTRSVRLFAGAIVATVAIAAAAVIAIVVISRVGNTYVPAMSAADTVTADYEYVIPLGTGAAVDRGEPVGILPDELTAHVGEVMRIVNNDDRGHLIGPFYVDAGQTLTQRFDSPGKLVGQCSVHEDGRFVLEIVP